MATYTQAPTESPGFTVTQTQHNSYSPLAAQQQAAQMHGAAADTSASQLRPSATEYFPMTPDATPRATGAIHEPNQHAEDPLQTNDAWRSASLSGFLRRGIQSVTGSISGRPTQQQEQRDPPQNPWGNWRPQRPQEGPQEFHDPMPVDSHAQQSQHVPSFQGVAQHANNYASQSSQQPNMFVPAPGSPARVSGLLGDYVGVPGCGHSAPFPLEISQGVPSFHNMPSFGTDASTGAELSNATSSGARPSSGTVCITGTIRSSGTIPTAGTACFSGAVCTSGLVSSSVKQLCSASA